MTSPDHKPSITVATDQIQVLFTNGSGTLYQLDAEIGDGHLVMSRRDQAMAKAMLELALANVGKAEAP